MPLSFAYRLSSRPNQCLQHFFEGITHGDASTNPAGSPLSFPPSCLQKLMSCKRQRGLISKKSPSNSFNPSLFALPALLVEHYIPAIYICQAFFCTHWQIYFYQQVTGKLQASYRQVSRTFACNHQAQADALSSMRRTCSSTQMRRHGLRPFRPQGLSSSAARLNRHIC